LNGAESVLRTLADSGVSVCFANPGTSEMHLVAALDRVPEVRGVLTLFEGVASGAADGYARMAGGPAATLLHLGPGFGNAFANVHNAFKARTPLVNVVGDHAVAHKPLGAPLASDIESVVRPCSAWVRTVQDARSAALDTAEAVAAARSQGVATLIVPADAGWDASLGPVGALPVPGLSPVPSEAVSAAAAALRAPGAALLLGGAAAGARGLDLAARIASATGAALLRDTFAPRLARGGSRPRPVGVPYLTEMAVDALKGFSSLVLVDTRRPVGFFAYPGQPSVLDSPSTDVVALATPGEDALGALAELADAVGAPSSVAVSPLERVALPSDGALNVDNLSAAVGALLPDDAVVVDEAVTASVLFVERTAGACEHDYLFLTGGSIGWGMPAATGAAVGAGGRPVVNLEADGSAMYTIQSLWTQAREGLDVTTIIIANRSYAILEFEFSRVGAEGDGAAARELMDIARPELSFAGLAQSMGVPGRRVEDVGGLVSALREAFSQPGPHLIEAVV
jgi:acetolactate synthase-1/2/3 large subunit